MYLVIYALLLIAYVAAIFRLAGKGGAALRVPGTALPEAA
jgi:hypothetical protein